MKKSSVLNRAIQLADRKAVKPEAVVVAAKVETYSCRLYTRLKPSEMKRLTDHIGKMMPVSELLRDLVLQYLGKKDHENKAKRR